MVGTVRVIQFPRRHALPPAPHGRVTLDDVAAGAARQRAVDAAGRLRSHVLILERLGQTGPLDTYIKAVHDRYAAAMTTWNVSGGSSGPKPDRCPASLGSLKQNHKHREAVKEAALLLRPPPPAPEPQEPAPVVEMWTCHCGQTFDGQQDHACTDATQVIPATPVAAPDFTPAPPMVRKLIHPARDLDTPGPEDPPSTIPPSGPGASPEPRQDDEALDQAAPLAIGHWGVRDGETEGAE